MVTKVLRQNIASHYNLTIDNDHNLWFMTLTINRVHPPYISAPCLMKTIYGVLEIGMMDAHTDHTLCIQTDRSTTNCYYACISSATCCALIISIIYLSEHGFEDFGNLHSLLWGPEAQDVYYCIFICPCRGKVHQVASQLESAFFKVTLGYGWYSISFQ